MTMGVSSVPGPPTSKSTSRALWIRGAEAFAPPSVQCLLASRGHADSRSRAFGHPFSPAVRFLDLIVGKLGTHAWMMRARKPTPISVVSISCEASDSRSRKILLHTKDVDVSSRAREEPTDLTDPEHGGQDGGFLQRMTILVSRYPSCTEYAAVQDLRRPKCTSNKRNAGHPCALTRTYKTTVSINEGEIRGIRGYSRNTGRNRIREFNASPQKFLGWPPCNDTTESLENYLMAYSNTCHQVKGPRRSSMETF
ncbi:hypothetical protein F5141DRAFT_362283 [Pisolithus sp. B1]|nr:hypothetical protein F5141DRAFT_362283 [Pisolithus sp. B1]